MEHVRWKEVAEERLTELAARRVLHTELMTVSRLVLKKGAVVGQT